MEASKHIQHNNQRAENPEGYRPRNRPRAPGVDKSTVLLKRARRQQVEIAVGIGHPEMPPEHVARGLAKIGRKGVRTSIVREWAGFPAVLSPDIPAGTFAMRTADRITAYSLETALPVAAVACGAAGIGAEVSSNG